jgi:putative FmdB family regulatory protein
MPIYEYRCADCGHELETLQRFSDEPLVVCPECKANALVKKVSAAGFQLKGSGWYVTDFRDKAKAPGKTKDTGTPAADKPAGEGKTDSAPAAKAETAPSAPAATTAPSSTPTTGSTS